MCHMSEDFVVEILSWLPVKSLLRFKCVCKLWCTIIGSPFFICAHTKKGDKNDGQLLIYRSQIGDRRCAPLLFPDEALERESPYFLEPNYLQIPIEAQVVAGPLDGLFCLHHDRMDEVTLWNPASRLLKPLPKPCLGFSEPNYCNAFGLGFDHTINRYKLVCIRRFRHREMRRACEYVSVLTMGIDDSWRQIRPVLPSDDFIQSSLSHTYVKGVYYWLFQFNDDGNLYILSFEMSKEVFVKEQVLCKPDMTGMAWGSLAMYNGSIAIFLYDDLVNETSMEVWVMKDEGKWWKLLTVGPFSSEVLLFSLGIWKNDQIIIVNKRWEVLLYDPKTQKIKDLIRGVGARWCCYCVFGYKGSLISSL